MAVGINAEVIEGDCLEVMRGMAPGSVDAVVTDPPYGLAFMGKTWDQPTTRTWHLDRWSEALRVLKPGGYLLAFGGTRTSHRLVCAIEDAGFEIRDTIAWMYGSGFPKSLDVSKAIDKATGAEREIIGERVSAYGTAPVGDELASRPGGGAGLWAGDAAKRVPLTGVPVTEDAARWDGWGTALKPAHEPIVLARKPLSEKNVAANVLRWGTGALNIDGCRLDGIPAAGGAGGLWSHYRDGTEPRRPAGTAAGRWPANVALDEEAAAALDAQTGAHVSGYAEVGSGGAVTQGTTYGEWPDGRRVASCYADSGGASRFFYCAKADRAERDAGLAGMAKSALNWSSGDANPGSFQSPNTKRKARNDHPTVKPVALMRWLCRLVTPPGGLILDPFAGSGSTLVAAAIEGFDSIGIEKYPHYCEIARRRVALATAQMRLPLHELAGDGQ